MNSPPYPEGPQRFDLEARSRFLEDLGRVLSAQNEWSLICLHVLLSCSNGPEGYSRQDLTDVCLRAVEENEQSCWGPFFVRQLSPETVQESIARLMEWGFIAPFEEFASQYTSLLEREESNCDVLGIRRYRSDKTVLRDDLSLTRTGILMAAYFCHHIAPPGCAECEFSGVETTTILSNHEFGTIPSWGMLHRKVSACVGRTVAFGPARIDSWWMPYSVVYARIYSESDLGQ